ncbi:MAG: SNF2-related protein, partial [Prosthecobacter sp.]
MEITEKWLGEIGGWQVMKTARGLVDAGMASVSSADLETGLVRGVAGGGKMKFTTGLRIRSKSDVENLCTCPHAKRTGMMCEHALAVALAHVRQQAAPAKPPPSSKAAAPYSSNPSHSSHPSGPATPPRTERTQTTAAPPPATVPGRFSVFLPETILQGQAKEPFGVFLKYETDSDSETSPLVTWLAGQGVRQPQSLPISLRGEGMNVFLQTLADHPRVFVGKPNGQARPLQVAAEPVRLPLVVESASSEKVRLQLAGGASQRPVLGNWWVCPETGALFRHSSDSPELATLAAELGRTGSALRPLRWLAEQGERLAESFQMDLRGGLENFHVSPVPCEFEIHLEGSLQTVEARVFARYGPHRWPVMAEGAELNTTIAIFPIQDESSEKVFYVWNREAERRVLRRLEQLGFQAETVKSWRLQGGENVLRFYASDVTHLRELGTLVEGERWRTATRGVQRIAPQTRFVAASGSGGGRPGGGDWLNMEFAYESADGFRLARAEVLRLVRSGQRSVQANGKRYLLDVAAVDELEESLRDVPLQLTPEGARVHGAHAAYFGGEDRAETTQAPITDDEVQAEIGDLAKLLRPYQMEGVTWMTTQVLRGRGGVLADEMGLGKTVQSIALSLFIKKRENLTGEPILVVCPKSLLGNWQAEFERFAPDLRVLLVQGSGREKALSTIAVHDVVLTSYQLIIRDIQYYQNVKFSVILLDEASFIRNPDTDAAKTLRSLKAGGRIALTGTPLENGVRDLWSIFQFSLPGYLGAASSFKERFETPIQGGLDLPAGRAAALRLQKLTQPYFLRRTKRQVLKDLPEKIEQVLWCTPSQAQMEFYRRILEEGREEIKAARKRSGQGGAKMTMFTV